MSTVLFSDISCRDDVVMFQVAQLSDRDWDTKIDEFSLSESGSPICTPWSPFLYSGWAHLKEIDGWTCLRLLDSRSEPVTQILYKKFGPLTVAYCPGGILTRSTFDATGLSDFLSNELRSRLLYARVNFLLPSSNLTDRLVGRDWKRVAHRFGAKSSLELDLSGSEADRESRLSANWRRNLRRGMSRDNDASIVSQASVTDIVELASETNSIKGRGITSWMTSPSHVQRIIERFDSRLVVAKVKGPDGEPRALRGAIITGGCAFEILASASADGRKQYSSHVALWTLANELSKRGVTKYDLGGIDRESNTGVYNFKQGTGAVEFNYVGEFDLSFPSFIRPIVSRLIKYRSEI